MINIQKAAIIGCGFVGTSIAFSLVQKGIFSELVLIDANEKKAEGEAMDLSHGLPFTKPMEIRAGSYEDIADCAMIIIPKIVEKNQEATLLIVSNPVDIMTYVALKLSGYPRHKVIGSGTVLDTARLKYLLSRHLDVDSRSIHAFIIGEHGDSELAVWSAANVSGIPLNHFCELRGYFDHMESMDRIYQSVRDSAYEIIEKKGATYYGVAMAVCRIAESVIRNEHSIMPISVYLDGLYGLHDICLSIPTVVGQEGAEKVLDIPLDLMEMGKLVYSAEELKKIIGELEL